MDSVGLILSKIYYDPGNPAAFGSVDKLLNEARRKNKRIQREQVESWLSGQDTYTLHKSIKRKFQRVPTYVDHVDSVWQMDTADVRHLVKYNNKIKYLLIIVDVLSRFAFVVPMENKSANRVVKALQDIQKEFKRKPKVVVSDPGLEFRGEFTKYLKRVEIEQYLLRVEQKAPFAERFIRTLKEKMVKYMTHNSTKNYMPAIADLVRAYNNTVHSRTKMKPIDVTNQNEGKIKQIMYGKFENNEIPWPKFDEGDMVRQVKKLKQLEKGTTQTTTDEVFIIADVDFSRPPRILYRIKDIAGDYIKGRFYEDELVRVKTVPDPHEYMKPGKKRVKKTKRITQTFNTFKGWPKKFDVRIHKSSTQK